MRTAIALALASVALVTAGPAAPAVPKSGIRGVVIKSPTRPVCEEGVPCSAPAAGVKLAFLRGGVRVAIATTSKAGTYRVVLRPGTYVVRSLRKLPLGGFPPRTVRVRQGCFTVANLEIDTGIR
jgi:hypothetical protein